MQNKKQKPPAKTGGFKKQITGIEPASSAWEADVLPMNYICTDNGNETRYLKNKGIIAHSCSFVKHFFTFCIPGTVLTGDCASWSTAP